MTYNPYSEKDLREWQALGTVRPSFTARTLDTIVRLQTALELACEEIERRLRLCPPGSIGFECPNREGCIADDTLTSRQCWGVSFLDRADEQIKKEMSDED